MRFHQRFNFISFLCRIQTLVNSSSSLPFSVCSLFHPKSRLKATKSRHVQKNLFYQFIWLVSRICTVGIMDPLYLMIMPDISHQKKVTAGVDPIFNPGPNVYNKDRIIIEVVDPL